MQEKNLFLILKRWRVTLQSCRVLNMFCTGTFLRNDDWHEGHIWENRVHDRQDRQGTYNVTLTSTHATTVAVEKSISITYSEHVFVASGIQHTMHMWLARLYNILPHYLINSKLLKKKKKLYNIKCILISSTTFVWNISILRRNEQDMIKNIY